MARVRSDGDKVFNGVRVGGGGRTRKIENQLIQLCCLRDRGEQREMGPS